MLVITPSLFRTSRVIIGRAFAHMNSVTVLFYRHEHVAHRPKVMGGQRDSNGDQCESAYCRNETCLGGSSFTAKKVEVFCNRLREPTTIWMQARTRALKAAAKSKDVYLRYSVRASNEFSD